jgi:hypothetical protein
MEIPCNLLSNVTHLKYKLLLIMTAMIEMKRYTKTRGNAPRLIHNIWEINCESWKFVLYILV